MAFNQSNKINFDYLSSVREHIPRSDYYQIIHYVILYFVVVLLWNRIHITKKKNTLQDCKREAQEIY